MSIIKKQAAAFYQSNFERHGNYEDFIRSVRSQLYEYRKQAHKLEFINNLIILVKQGYDEHLLICQHKNNPEKCGTNTNYENSLFFIQNELDELSENIPISEFSLTDRTNINASLEKIISDLDKIKMGQELTYDDFVKEFSELKELYYLNKKNWSQLLVGKLSDMIASGIISETISKDIVESVSKNYDGLIA